MATTLHRPKNGTSTNGHASRIAWITPPDEASLPEEVRAHFARQRERTGAVHNSALVSAHNPAVLLAQSAFSAALFNPDGGALTPRERELIAVVVSAENRCEPCTVGHTAKLRQLRATRIGSRRWRSTIAAPTWTPAPAPWPTSRCGSREPRPRSRRPTSPRCARWGWTTRRSSRWRPWRPTSTSPTASPARSV